MGLGYDKINKVFVDNFNFVVLRRFPRYSTRFAKKHFQNRGIVAMEIGTLEGRNAKSILKELNVEKLYVVDPYENYGDGKSNKLLSKAETSAKRRLKKYKNKIVWIKEYSDDAANIIKEKVDFIYIDGNHEYEYVKRDMENYFKKLKKGGVLVGHDITWESVSKAVEDFCKEKGINFRVMGQDWWFVKE